MRKRQRPPRHYNPPPMFGLRLRRYVATLADWDALLGESYMRDQIVGALNDEICAFTSMLRKQSAFEQKSMTFKIEPGSMIPMSAEQRETQVKFLTRLGAL